MTRVGIYGGADTPVMVSSASLACGFSSSALPRVLLLPLARPVAVAAVPGAPTAQHITLKPSTFAFSGEICIRICLRTVNDFQ